MTSAVFVLPVLPLVLLSSFLLLPCFTFLFFFSASRPTNRLGDFNNIRFQRYGQLLPRDLSHLLRTPSRFMPYHSPFVCFSSRRTDFLPAHSASACIHVCTMVPQIDGFFVILYQFAMMNVEDHRPPKSIRKQLVQLLTRCHGVAYSYTLIPPARLMLTRDARYVHVLYIQLHARLPRRDKFQELYACISCWT